ncbi:MAG: RING finger family 4 domain-containing protein [Kofleriaceae bacterium]
MDALRTLLLSRTHTVVLDPERAANAATRPSRGADLERFEDELARLGFVMSLDLAMMVRRLPGQAAIDLRKWLIDTLTCLVDPARATTAPFHGSTMTAVSSYARRMISWLRACPDQPCPWCARVSKVRALSPCGHLVCEPCWGGGNFAGCPICNHRIAPTEPFIAITPSEPATTDTLQLLYVAFDLIGTARARFQRLVGDPAPMTPADRIEIETMIDALGDKAVGWLPAKIANRETRAIALARLWMVSPDPSAVVRATERHLQSPSDVLRVAAVLLGGNPELLEPMKLHSVRRGLRRAILEALDRQPIEQLREGVRTYRTLWKRIGECTHPYEHAARLPAAALAFATVRGTDLTTAPVGEILRAKLGAAVPGALPAAPAIRGVTSAVERGLVDGSVGDVARLLADRPHELVQRADHLLRTAQHREPGELAPLVASIDRALPRVEAQRLFLLIRQLAGRSAPAPARVFRNRAGSRWRTDDRRQPLAAETIAAITASAHHELVSRAQAKRLFARSVIDRATANARLVLKPRVAVVAGAAKPYAPTLWDVACVHAAARTNLIYIRELDGSITAYRTRDRESAHARHARLWSGTDYDGKLLAIPASAAPTWFALVRYDLTLATGSEGITIDAKPISDRVTVVGPVDILAALDR